MKIYISKSNLVNPDDLINVRKILEDHDIQIAEYKGGEYSSEPLKTSDLLVSISYPGAVEGNMTYLGKGSFSELDKALQHNIPVLFYDGLFHVVTSRDINDTKDFQKRFGKVFFKANGFDETTIGGYLKTVPIMERTEETNLEDPPLFEMA